DRLRPDLVIMDLTMPGMNGLEATRRLKARPGAPRVVILSLHDSEAHRAVAAAAGADAYASKSEFGDALLGLIQALLA
ncbi:MAG: response regulator, partial [Armatimonadetes bacterium]|nr:response regulator [Armatimonadota bacterium]